MSRPSPELGFRRMPESASTWWDSDQSSPPPAKLVAHYSVASDSSRLIQRQLLDFLSFTRPKDEVYEVNLSGETLKLEETAYGKRNRAEKADRKCLYDAILQWKQQGSLEGMVIELDLGRSPDHN